MKPDLVPPTNKLILIPLGVPVAIRQSFIVKDTNHYCSPKTKEGLLLPESDSTDMVDKKYRIGEVISVGSECVDIKLGDIVIYMVHAASRIPNGAAEAIMYKLDETPMGVLCRLPKQEGDELAMVEKAFEEAANEKRAADAVQESNGEDEVEPSRHRRGFTKSY
jgi:co-chaperonin GroES (HSP10)